MTLSNNGTNSKPNYTEIRDARVKDFEPEIKEMLEEMTYFWGLEKEIKRRILDDTLSGEPYDPK